MPEMTDAERERQIDKAYFELIGARSPAGRRKAWAKMQCLVLGRSERRQTEMALERNLPLPPHSNTNGAGDA